MWDTTGTDAHWVRMYITYYPATCASPVVADFQSDNDKIELGDVRGIDFTDFSTGNPTLWNWSFGDNEYSDEQNPTHVWMTAGTYTVTLNASNGVYSDIETKVDYIRVFEVPTANFTSNVTSGVDPLAVQFTDTSTNAPTAWGWSFQCWTTEITGFESGAESIADWTFYEFVEGDNVNTFDVSAPAAHSGSYGGHILVETIAEPDAGIVTATSPAIIPADFTRLSFWIQHKQGHDLNGATAYAFLRESDGDGGVGIVPVILPGRLIIHHILLWVIGYTSYSSHR